MEEIKEYDHVRCIAREAIPGDNSNYAEEELEIGKEYTVTAVSQYTVRNRETLSVTRYKVLSLGSGMWYQHLVTNFELIT